MKSFVKSALTFIALSAAISVLLAYFILPSTGIYKEASEMFYKLLSEKGTSLQDNPTYFTGFIIGYVIFHHGWVVSGIILTGMIISLIVIYILRKTGKRNNNGSNSESPYDLLLNILSTILLFTTGIFNRRASEPLKYYFGLPVRSKITGLTAYILVFIVLGSLSSAQYAIKEMLYLGLFDLLIFTSLISITLFVPSFQENYQRRLFRLSFFGYLLLTLVSIVVTLYLTRLHTETDKIDYIYIQSMSINVWVTRILVILAFSFYTELMKRITKEKNRMETELMIVRNIQNMLVPDINTSNENFEIYGKIISAGEVGGDYIDLITLGEDKKVLAVADVSGHTVASGLLMSMLKTAFHTELKYFKNEELLTASLNKTIHQNKKKNMFISFLFGIMDIRGNQLTMINSGHPPVLHYSARSGEVDEYRTGDIALGLVENAVFKSIRIPYEPGDIFLFFTDGIMEITNKTGDEFGINGIKKVMTENPGLSSAEMYETLISEAFKFSSDKSNADDMTALILKIKS